MSKRNRARIFVDRRVQGALMLRTAMYWVFCLIAITLMILCWRIVTGPARPFYMHFDAMWFHYGPAFIASLLLLPVVLIDNIRISNRFVGPILRLRRSMRMLADGQPVKPIHFRGGDFWQEMAEEFNAVLMRVHPEIRESDHQDLQIEPLESGCQDAGRVDRELVETTV